jgi:hypothetical protein
MFLVSARPSSKMAILQAQVPDCFTGPREALAADMRRRRLAQVRQIDALEQILHAGQLVAAATDIHQSRFAATFPGTRSTYEGDQLNAGNREAFPIKRTHRRITQLVQAGHELRSSIAAPRGHVQQALDWRAPCCHRRYEKLKGCPGDHDLARRRIDGEASIAYFVRQRHPNAFQTAHQVRQFNEPLDRRSKSSYSPVHRMPFLECIEA